MALGRDIYDIRGRILLQKGDELTEETLHLVCRSGTSEILVDDLRVADVPVGSLFPATLEAKAVQALHMLIASLQGIPDGPRPDDLIDIKSSAYQMMKRLIPDVVGDPDLCSGASHHGYDYVHPIKVAGLSMLLGRWAGLGEEELIKVGVAATLQNLGYLSLPPGILETPDSLNKRALQQLYTHPEMSAKMLADSGLESDTLVGSWQHHERWDGSRYPDGKKGEEISLIARLIAIPDVYHALQSVRPHRKAYLPHEAIEFIVAYSGLMFDPGPTKLFAKQIPQYPAGLGVRLSTGEIAIVSHPNTGEISRPIVRICVKNGSAVREPYDLDLTLPDCMNKLIVEILL